MNNSSRAGRGMVNTGYLISLILFFMLTPQKQCNAGSEFSFALSEDAPDLVGELSFTTTVYEDTLSDLARAYDQGYTEMRLANPEVDPWLPGEDSEVLVPSLYVLPNAPRNGIVVNTPEMRMYVFKTSEGHPKRLRVTTYPISIGRQNWHTPSGIMKIVAKAKDPAWYPPESIRKEHAEEGDDLPRIVPPGPDNPLGRHAIRLSLAGYLIHGTNKPYGIGMRVTHGCIRMYPKDVEAIFKNVPVGTPVYIVNQPFKVGMAFGHIYLEAHPHLKEDSDLYTEQYANVVALILGKLKDFDADLRWADIKTVLEDRSGVPVSIGTLKLRPEGSPPETGLTKLAESS